MVVVNANVADSICIWRFNRFRAKLCYRAVYLHAVLGGRTSNVTKILDPDTGAVYIGNRTEHERPQKSPAWRIGILR